MLPEHIHLLTTVGEHNIAKSHTIGTDIGFILHSGLLWTPDFKRTFQFQIG